VVFILEDLVSGLTKAIPEGDVADYIEGVALKPMAEIDDFVIIGKLV
jgi:hypothetical protein